MFEDEVRQTSDRFYEGVNKMFTGDLGLLESIWSHAPDVSNAGPFGIIYTGWDEVHNQLIREAGIKMEGSIHPRDLMVRVTGELGFTVCVEEGTLTVNGQPVHVSQRATSVYRREYGQWKLIHHHSDFSESLVLAESREEVMAGESSQEGYL